MQAVNASEAAVRAYRDQPTRSPWLAQLADDGPPRPLDADTSADVAVVGAGIAGVATAFFVLRNTPYDVLLIERDRVARGATGRNAGQLTTYFERPLGAIERVLRGHGLCSPRVQPVVAVWAYSSSGRS